QEIFRERRLTKRKAFEERNKRKRLEVRRRENKTNRMKKIQKQKGGSVVGGAVIQRIA
ncbi:24625_t:CDS:2, partial [Cetraspora pellucida]